MEFIDLKRATELSGQSRDQLLWLAATRQVRSRYLEGENRLLIDSGSLSEWFGIPLSEKEGEEA